MSDLRRVENLEILPFSKPTQEASDPPSSLRKVENLEILPFSEEPSKLKEFAQGVVKGADLTADLAKGLVRGPWNLLTGIGETLTGVVDLALDTNITPSFSKGMAEFASGGGQYDPATGKTTGGYYDPKYTVGKIGEVGSEIGIEVVPFMKFLSTVNRAAKAKKTGTTIVKAKSKTGRALQKLGESKYGQAMVDDGISATSRLKSYAATGGLGAVYFGTTGALFAPDSRPTLLGDTFSEVPLPFTDTAIPLPFGTERTSGVEGREAALELGKRKLLRGLDQATLSILGDAGLFGLGSAARAPVVAQTAAATTRGIRTATQAASQAMAESALVRGMSDNPIIQKIGASVQRPKRLMTRLFTPDGGADEFLSRSLRDSVDTGDAIQREIIAGIDDFHQATDNLLVKTKFWKQPKPQAKDLQTDLNLLLRGGSREDFVTRWGEGAAKAVDKMNDSLFKSKDRGLKMLENEIQSLPVGADRTKKAQEAMQVINDLDEAGEQYLRRLFEAHENPVRFLKNLDIKDPLYNKAIDEVERTLRSLPKQKNMSNDLIRKMATEEVNNSLGLPGLSRPGADFDTVVKEKINALKDSNSKMMGLVSGDTPKLSVKEDFLIKRKEVLEKSPAFRALLGEITSPLEVVIRTVSDLTQTTTAKGYYDSIAINKQLAPTISKAMDLIDNGGRPPVVMVPTAATFDARNKILNTMGKNADTRTAASAANKGSPSDEALLEISERMSGGKFGKQSDTVAEGAELARMEEILKGKGYTRLGGDEAAEEGLNTIFGGRFGKLNGMWVTPETRAMLNQPVNLSPLAGVMSSLQNLRAFSQKMTIVPSPAGQAKNIFGNLAMLVGNGNLHRGTNLLDTFYTFSRSLDEVNDQGLQDIARRINYSGLQDSNVIFKSLKEYQQMGRQLELGEKASNIFDKAEDLIPFMSQFESLYKNSDAFFKSVALNGEYNKLASAVKRSGFDLNDPTLLDTLVQAGIAKPQSKRVENMSYLEEIAATIVKDVMPMYNRVPQALRFMDRIPFFGNFTSFASENIRNGFNTLYIASKELAFEVGPGSRKLLTDRLVKRGVSADVAEAQIKAFEGSIRANGSQRMFNTLAVSNIVPAQMTKLSQRLTYTSEEQMQAIQDSQEDFMAGDDFIVLSNDHKGNFTVMNTSYHNPYGYIRSAANAGLEAYARAGKLNKNEVQQIGSGLMGFFEKMADPFASESMVMERIADATVRRGKTRNGSTVYGQDESWGTWATNSLGHILESVVPRYALEVAEFDKGEIVPGKLNRALQGLPGKNNEDLNVGQEFVRMGFGLTPLEIKGGAQVEYSAYNYTSLRDPAASRLKAAFKDPDRTAESMFDVYLDSIDSIAKQQSQMHYDILNAQILGVPQSEIKRRLRQAGLGKAESQALINGELYIKGISADLVKELNERKRFEDFTQIEELPIQRVIDYVRKNNGTSLESRAYQEDQGIAVEPSGRYRIIDPKEILPYEESSLQPTMQAPAAPVQPMQAPPPVQPMQAPAAPVNTALLGGNPAEQAANAFLQNT